MAIREFRLPDPGEGLVEADIVTWHVKVGDQVKINDIVVEVETSKSLVELPTPYAGRVTGLLVSEGDTVDVGTPIIAIDDGTAAPVVAPAAPAVAPPRASSADSADLVPGVPDAPDSEAGKRVPNLVGYGVKHTEAKRRPRKGAADPGPAQAHDDVAAGTFATDVPVSRRADDRSPLAPAPAQAVGAPLPSPGRAPAAAPLGPVTTLAKPPVRKVAKDLGVDLSTVSGTGPGGVITRDDVEAAAREVESAVVVGAAEAAGAAGAVGAGGAAASESVAAAGAGGSARGVAKEDVRLPIRGVRKATAEAMVRSAFTAPHVSEWVTCDVSATMELLDRLKARREFKDVRLSPTVLIAKAVLLALQQTPELNSAWDEAAGEIVIKGSINLGIAAATPRGLVVPNIKDAQTLSLRDLAVAINAAVATAREGKTQPADMARGSFTITNVGVFGVDAGTPILNPGESGIVCVGQIARRPWVVGSGTSERIEPRWVTTLAVSFDHRLADGEQGSRFLANVAGLLGDPGLALLF